MRHAVAERSQVVAVWSFAFAVLKEAELPGWPRVLPLPMDFDVSGQPQALRSGANGRAFPATAPCLRS